MTEKIVSNEEFRNGIQQGINQLADPVKDTLGPMGNTVIVKNAFGAISITKDGVSVAEEIEFDPNTIEAIGANLVKNVALKANNLAGDGTTTATVLAQAIYNVGRKQLDLGVNAGDFNTGLKIARIDILKYLEGMKKMVTPESPELKSVALISSNGEEDIAETITKIYKKLGVHGVISVTQGSGMETTMNMITGMQFDRGYLSPYCVTDTIKMKVDFENPYVFLYDGKISQFKQIYEAVEYAGQKNRPIIFVAEDVNESALRGLAANHIRGNVRSAIVMAPGYGNKRVERLRDMAILFGGELVTKEMVIEDGQDQFNPMWLGEMEKAEITSTDTAFIGGTGKEEDILKRAQHIQDQLVHHKGNKYEVDILETRLGKLTSGVAMVKVGANSSEEAKELLDRVEDCKHAVKAALAEGIVPGGGTALVEAAMKFEAKVFKDTIKPGVKAGYQALCEAVKAPYNQILINAGLIPEVIQLECEIRPSGTGYNVRTENYVPSLIEDGVIDPVKVVRIALESSVSIVGTLLTSNYAIINKDDVTTTQFQ